MANVNVVLLAGHLTRDPEVRHLPSGQAVCNFGLAVNRKFKTAAGEEREEVLFVDCESWGKSAENLGRFFSKGSGIFITGKLKLDQWETEGGEKRSKHKVTVDDWQFCDKKGGDGEAPAKSAKASASKQIDEDSIPF